MNRISSFSGTGRYRAMLVTGGGLLALLMGLIAVTPDSASAKYKQPGCAKYAKKVAKSKGTQKKIAKLKLKSCKDTRSVYNRVKNSRFVGARADGQPVDITLCANGKMADEVGTPYEQVVTAGWRIDVATVRGKYFEAGFAAKLDGGERVGALKLSKAGWQVGIYSLGRFSEFGDVERTDARKLCGSL